MDEDEYFGPAQDIMSLRVGMMVHVAESLENIHDVEARGLLITAMTHLLYTCSPPRGEVVEMKH